MNYLLEKEDFIRTFNYLKATNQMLTETARKCANRKAEEHCRTMKYLMK